MASELSGIDAIGRTAFAVASLRAAEHRNPEGLFTDPYAERILRAAGMPLEPQADSRGFAAVMGAQVVVRSRYFDDLLLGAAATGCRQIVLVASGMDSRPWRLAWPEGTVLFEVEQEPVLRFKDHVMDERDAQLAGLRHPVATDLRDDWASALREAGFHADLPTAWLVEGLLYALEETSADQLLAVLSELSAPGSVLAFDHFEVGPSLRAATDRISPDLTRLWKSGPPDPAAWLHRHGWEPSIHELADVADSFGRTVHPAYTPGPAAEGHSWLASATRTTATRTTTPRTTAALPD